MVYAGLGIGGILFILGSLLGKSSERFRIGDRMGMFVVGALMIGASLWVFLGK